MNQHCSEGVSSEEKLKGASMGEKKKAARQERSHSRVIRERGVLKYKKVFPIVFLACLLMFTLSAVGYVIFFRTVLT